MSAAFYTEVVWKLTGLSDGVSNDKDDKEPPARNLLVDLHLLVVLVVDHEGDLVPRVKGNEERLEVLPVVERDVGDGGTERQVGSDEVEGVGGGEVSGAELGVRLRVEPSVLQKSGLVVLGTVRSLVI